MLGIEERSQAPKSPFVGLTTFSQDDAGIFFGRDTERSLLISNLRASRLTLLYGRSGTGKSSLLRAGVASRLQELARRSQRERGTPWNVPVVFSSWRSDPADELISAIQAAVAPFVRGDASGRLPRTGLESALAAASVAADATVLVILDQFEEYLLAGSGEERADGFADELAACLKSADLRAHFLIAVREDAYSALGDLFKGRIDNVYGNYLRLEDLERELARDAITKPVEGVNEQRPELDPVVIEPLLVEAVLDQLSRPEELLLGPAGDEPGDRSNGAVRTSRIPPPYLQLVMQRLWDADVGSPAGSNAPALRLATLTDLGGASTIVRTHVDRALDSLADRDRDTALDIFQHMVTSSGTKIALGASDLVEFTDRSEAELENLLERLTRPEARILTDVAVPSSARGTRYEIAHDLLAPAILTWRARQRAARLERERNAAQEQAALEQQRAKKFRVMSYALGFLALGLAAIGIAAFVLWRTAESNKKVALAGESAAQARALVDYNSQQALGDSLAAIKLSDSSAASSALRTIAPVSLRLVRALRGTAEPQWAEFAGGASLATFTTPRGPGSGSLTLWSLQSGRKLLQLPVTHPVHGRPQSPFLASVAIGDSGQTAVLVPAPALVSQPPGPAQLWNLQTRKPVARLGTTVAGAAASSQNDWILTWAPHGPAVVWRSNGNLGHGVPLPNSVDVQAAAFSPNGHVVATIESTHHGTAVKVWRVQNGRWRYVGEQSPRSSAATGLDSTTSVEVSPGNPRVAIQSGADVDLLKVTGLHLQPPQPVQPQSATGINTVSFGASGGRLVTAGEDGVARVYSTLNGALENTMPSAGSTKSAVLSSDGALVATGGNDGRTTIWAAGTGLPSLVLGGDGSAIDSVAFNSTNTRLATTSADGVIRVWRLEPPEKAAIRGAAYDVSASRGNPDHIAIAGTLHGPYVWIPGHRPVALGRTPSDGVAITQDGRYIVTTTAVPGQNAKAILWNGQLHTRLRSVTMKQEPNNPPTTIAHHPSFAPDGKRIVLATSVGARIWQPGLAKRMLSGPFNADYKSPAVTVAAYSPSGGQIVTGQPNGVTLWGVARRNPPQGPPPLPHLIRTRHLGDSGRGAPVVAVAFSPSGRYLVAGDRLGRIRVWDLHNGDVRVAKLRLSTIPTDLNFNPVGNWILIAGTDGTVRIWNWKEGLVLATEQISAGAARAAEYVPGHPNEILTGGDDGLVEFSTCPTCVSTPALEALVQKHLDSLSR